MLLHHFNRQVVRPGLVVLGRRHPVQPDLPEDVPLRYLARRHARNAVLDLSRIIAAQQPGIVCGAKTHVNTAVIAANLLAGRPSCAVLSEQMDLPAHVRHQHGSRRWKWRATLLGASCLYRTAADKVVFVSKGACEAGQRRLRLRDEMTTVIHNPIVGSELTKASQEPVHHAWFNERDDRPIVMGVGRLTSQKGFRYLLRAFQRIRESRPSRLMLVGDGEDRGSLAMLARELGVEEDVAFLGFQPNPHKFLARADVFVLPSLWEGLGMVLVEAMACDTPVVATRCPSGPEEIVTDGVDGLLVPPADADALADAILRVLTNRTLARKLSAAGRQRAEDFRVERAVQQYEQLFQSVVARTQPAQRGSPDPHLCRES
jgi:glycosyltransferase involved in cell wall biosynthesis